MHIIWIIASDIQSSDFSVQGQAFEVAVHRQLRYKSQSPETTNICAERMQVKPGVSDERVTIVAKSNQKTTKP